MADLELLWEFAWPLGSKIPQLSWGNKKLIAEKKPPMIR